LSALQKTMNRLYILVGSNIDPNENIKKGLKHLNQSDSIVVEAVSSEFISKPVGMEGSDFINIVLRCSTNLEFIETNTLLKEIEEICGRERDPQNKFTPRTLDLDIICWNNFEGIMEGYKLPDPDIEKYDYIKVPLSEVKL